MSLSFQSDFASALLDPERPAPDNVTSHTERHPELRFGVYRNNVVAGLINALRTKFPATERIVGNEFFAAMARVFVMAHPPRSKILHMYGDDFGDFIGSFPPAADLPYLPDVARLEAARTRAYHAADAEPLLPADLAKIDQTQIAAIRLALHPSLNILCSRHPVVSIWSMNAGETELRPIDQDQPEDALILRPAMDVIVRKLPPGGAAFLAALILGATLGEAASLAHAQVAQFDLTRNLAGLIGSGAVTGSSLAEGSIP